MGKPRIIIADTDINYIFPLQMKFVEEFLWKIDLEIISDVDYFNKTFESPQKADILIVSGRLYNAALKRHNISNIFVMTEQQEEDLRADANVHQIFKYTSIKEIFNEIIGKSGAALSVSIEVKKEPQIILVYSACGGAGKTTVAMGISACLTKNYKRVLYLNAERLQSFQRLLSNPASIAAADVYARLANANEYIYKDIKHVIRKEGFHYLPPFKAALMSLGLKSSIYQKIAEAAKKSNEYDFIVVDADSVFDDEKAMLLNIADKVIVVTKQTSAAVYATNVLVSNMNGVNAEKYIFICNDFKKEEENALISSDIPNKFTVSDYIEHIEGYDHIKVEELSKDKGIQKTAFLII